MQLSMGAGAGEVDETSPDMLKNTPSNIRRLANEIDQCEGRQKYLARTNSPSDGGDVRWYFCKVKVLTLFQSRSENDHDEDYEHIQEKEERSYGSIMMEKLTGREEGHIDHVL